MLLRPILWLVLTGRALAVRLLAPAGPRAIMAAGTALRVQVEPPPVPVPPAEAVVAADGGVVVAPAAADSPAAPAHVAAGHDPGVCVAVMLGEGAAPPAAEEWTCAQEPEFSISIAEEGTYTLFADSRAAVLLPGVVAAPAAPASTELVVVRAGSPFVPSSSWQLLAPWHTSLPPGLEVRLPLDGSGLREARIPPEWQFKVWANGRYVRQTVSDATPVAAIRATVAAALALPLERVALSWAAPLETAGEPPPPALDDPTATASSVDLWARRSQVVVEITP
jgi:hypothetical protein